MTAPTSGAQHGGIGRFLVQNSMIIGILALLAIFGIGNPIYLSAPNLANILLQSTSLAIIAVTSALLVISGEVDLSVGSVMALGAVLAGYLMVKVGLGPGTSTALGLAAGAAAGLVNGLLVTRARINSIVVTLGMSNIARGATLLIAVSPVFNFPEGFLSIGNARPLGLGMPIWIAAVVFVLGWSFLEITPTGRHLYAIGMNREAAYLAGLPVDWVRLALFVANGLAAALSGIVLASRLNSAPPGTLGLGFELQVLTAVLLGGIAFTGGRGRLTGVLLAVLFLAMLQAGLTIMNVANAWQLVLQGAALIGAVALDHLNYRRGSRATLPWRRWGGSGAKADGGSR
jgi:ribose transport system permease protein